MRETQKGGSRPMLLCASEGSAHLRSYESSVLPQAHCETALMPRDFTTKKGMTKTSEKKNRLNRDAALPKPT